ncbi:MAG: M61 family metallopeptidase [Deltaproteobacteria bacterium]|nr:M61 family metallopeptidase [Deltaproteobacteria bacterium]
MSVEPLHYTVDVPDPRTHHFHVTLTVPDAAAVTKLSFPRWTPGSYLLREHGRQLEELRAHVGGEPATATKLDPHNWEIRAPRAGSLTLSYRVYAHELTVRTAHLDDTHGFFNGVNLFLLPDGLEARPCTLAIHAPDGWRISTTLPARHDGTFAAHDFHHLCDCPVEMGTHRLLTFEVRGIPHELALWNRGNEDEARLVADLAKLVEENAKVFGGLPYKRYLFITHLTDNARGGLEHRDSTALVYPRFAFRPDKEYESYTTLACHEHFHTWNVKRIKPRPFAPYRYDRENPTRTLWAFEGITSYYDNLNTRRAGLMTADRYLAAEGELITQLWQTPGRLVHPLEDASLDAWIKFYRQDEHTVNSTVSYYLKGELVALCLDLLIRRETGGTRSLDDVMRLLWKWTQERGEGLDEGAVEAAAAEVAGRDLKAFFDRAVRSTEELPLAESLAWVGLELVARPTEGPDDKGGTAGKGTPVTRAWLGATVKKDGVVQAVLTGSPALRAGLAPGDQLVALGGYRVNDGGLAGRLDDARPGQVAELHFFRRDELRCVRVELGEQPATAAYVRRRENASAQEVLLRKSWLGAE